MEREAMAGIRTLSVEDLVQAVILMPVLMLVFQYRSSTDIVLVSPSVGRDAENEPYKQCIVNYLIET